MLENIRAILVHIWRLKEIIMDRIFGYISYMMPFMLIALVIYIIIRLIVVKKRKKRISIKREIPLMLFISYITGLLSITAFPKVVFNDGIRLVVGPGSVNLIPFRTIVTYFDERFIIFAILFAGNIVMFMPVGFFVPLIWKKGPLFTTMCGLLFSLFIEISQQFVVRNTDIDDLILITFGVYLGYLLYAAAKHIINRSKKSEEL